MIYKNHQQLTTDLNWLCKETTLDEFNAFKISNYQYNLFFDALNNPESSDFALKKPLTTSPTASPTDAAVLSFYDELLAEFDLEKNRWEKQVNIKMLPMLVLIPNLGMRIVVGLNGDGSYKLSGVNGIERFSSFPKQTKFKKIRLKTKDISKKSARQMFKSFALEQKKFIVYAIIASVSINILAISTSLYALQVYDRVIPTNGISTLISLTIGVSIAITLEMIVKFSRAAILDQAAKNMDVEYSYNIFERFLSVRSDALPKSIGSMSSRLQGYASVRSFISSAAMFIFVDFPFIFLFLGVIFLIGGWTIVQIILASLVIAILVGVFFKSRVEVLMKSSTLAAHKKMGLLVETVENSQVVKATNAKWSLINKWSKLTEDAIDDELKVKHYTDMSTFIATFVQQMSYVFVVAIGAYIIATSAALTMGGLIAITILSNRVFAPIGQIPNLLVQWGKANAAVDDLNEVYKLDRENEGIERPITNDLPNVDIDFANIKFAYGDNPTILNLPSLKINSGEKVAIVGAIGVGKSTILKLIAGLYKPTEGQVHFGGINSDHLSRDVISKNIGYLSQDNKLFSGTLRDNLIIGLNDVSDAEILHVAKLTGLMALISALPSGLDTPIPEGGDSVSGGQRQLISLTRVIIGNKKVLLMDEPTANMDEGTEKNIIKMFNSEVGKNKTIVLVTHRPVLLEIVDRVIVLTPRGVAMDDTKTKVLELLNPQIKRAREAAAATTATNKTETIVKHGETGNE